MAFAAAAAAAALLSGSLMISMRDSAATNQLPTERAAALLSAPSLPFNIFAGGNKEIGKKINK